MQSLWMEIENNWFLFMWVYFIQIYTFNVFTAKLLDFIAAHGVVLN